MDLEISFRKEGNISIIKPIGRNLDASTVSSFKKQTADWVQKGSYILLLNLANIDFIDSSGLGSIISLFKLVAENGNMAICNTRPTVQSLFRLTRMDKVFTIYHSEEEGIHALMEIHR